MFVVLLLAVALVAFTNGANANFKGVASLYGSGTASRKVALGWATVTTFAGSLAACYVASGLVKRFSGKGLVPDELILNPGFAVSVAFGSASTSFLATRFGFPVSTTHAMVGALIGAGFAGSGTQVQLTALGQNFIGPLLLSPLLALVLGAGVYPLLRTLRLAPDQRTTTLDVCHYATAGAASFTRGLNDTPKIVSLLLLIPQLDLQFGFAAVAMLIAIGGLIDSRRVAETLGKKITEMNPGQGFAASLVTACLVGTASLHSLPVSTTHVSVGALAGMGAVTGKIHWLMFGEIVLAWILTVPIGAFLGFLAFQVLGLLVPVAG